MTCPCGILQIEGFMQTFAKRSLNVGVFETTKSNSKRMVSEVNFLQFTNVFLLATLCWEQF